MQSKNYHGEKNRMTEEQKKMIQARHRLEEARNRDRVRERKERTRRLIQEGAILEKVFPQLTGLDLSELEKRLYVLSQKAE